LGPNTSSLVAPHVVIFQCLILVFIVIIAYFKVLLCHKKFSFATYFNAIHHIPWEERLLSLLQVYQINISLLLHTIRM